MNPVKYSLEWAIKEHNQNGPLKYVFSGVTAAIIRRVNTGSANGFLRRLPPMASLTPLPNIG